MAGAVILRKKELPHVIDGDVTTKTSAWHGSWHDQEMRLGPMKADGASSRLNWLEQKKRLHQGSVVWREGISSYLLKS